jgi:hypothetical protein
MLPNPFDFAGRAALVTGVRQRGRGGGRRRHPRQRRGLAQTGTEPVSARFRDLAPDDLRRELDITLMTRMNNDYGPGRSRTSARRFEVCCSIR